MKTFVQDHPGFLPVIIELTLLSLCILAVPVAISIDVLVFNHGVKEVSITEFSQSILLLVSTVCVGLAAFQNDEYRGFLVIVTCLFAAMLIRESDMFLDYIAQGFWVYPATIVGVATIAILYRLRIKIIPSIVSFSGTRAFTYLIVGLLLTVLFSRAFGTGWFWAEVMGEDYQRIYKTIIQEGLELLGYVFIFFGSVLTYKLTRAPNKAPRT